jgi:predicted TIM-barrel fold metal-dependent hydrolase
MKKYFFFLFIPGVFNAAAQTTPKMDFETYNPPSTLVVPEHKLTKAKFPFIDVHNHQFSMPTMDLGTLIKEMDKLNMKVMVNLSGQSGDQINKSVANIKQNYPARFIVFANVEFRGIGEQGWSEKAAKQLEEDVKNGANGLKIYKSLGFSVKDINGKRVTIDDPRLDPIWKKAGELKIPVIIHTADPKPFWDPMDSVNERWLELATHPNRKRSNTDPAPWDTLITEQHRMFKKHPKTTFIAAHFGWYPNDLAKLGQLLDEMPNVVVEFGAVIAELGRQPRMAKQFFTKYQDRILFGKDSWAPEEYATYFRVLETEDEYFPYHKKYHAFWVMYGMGLPDVILKKIYYKNALRIIPNIDKTLFPD